MDTNTIQLITNVTQGNVIAESAFPAVTGGTTRGVVKVPRATGWGTVSGSVVEAQLPQSVVDGHPFKVKASFKATGGGVLTFDGKLYWNCGSNTNLTTFSSDVKIADSGALAMAASTNSIYLEAICLWDSGSGRLMAVQGLCMNNIAANAILNSGAFTLFNTTTPVATAQATSDDLQFFATGLFGTTNAANSVVLVELSIEV